MIEPIEKSEQQWRAELDPDQYRVLREKGTEPAFSNAYWDCHEDGTYLCAACALPLFSSETKFDSGTGWPSFYAPLSDEVTALDSDDSYGMVRDEVICARCGSHLGHVFEDGPAPTGMRYCMNSISLQLQQN